MAVSAIALSLGISSCTTGASATGAAAQKTSVPADFPGITNSVPASPAAGQSRAGNIYNVYIQAPGTGEKVAFTVFEPSTLEGGKTYPLVLQAMGFGLGRETAASVANVKPLIDAGYGVISFDHRGHGESGGAVGNMDPDYEGKNVLAVLDWAEAKLDWLKYAPSGNDRHNLVLGSIGRLLRRHVPVHAAQHRSQAPARCHGGVGRAEYLTYRIFRAVEAAAPTCRAARHPRKAP